MLDLPPTIGYTITFFILAILITILVTLDARRGDE